jgi:hypothetical protein
MKSFFRSTVFILISLGIHFPAFSQTSKTIQRRIDSLGRQKDKFLTTILSYRDSIRKVEIEQENLTLQLIPARVSEHENDINRLLGSKGLKIKLNALGKLVRGPNNDAEFILFIEKNEKVDVLFLEKYPYYKVKYKKQIGYLNAECLTFEPSIDEHNIALSSMVINKEESRPNLDPQAYRPSISRSSSNLSSSKNACSSVQCTGTTKKGNRCKNTTTNCSGRCYQH